MSAIFSFHGQNEPQRPDGKIIEWTGADLGWYTLGW
jgi:hypothetical protein